MMRETLITLVIYMIIDIEIRGNSRCHFPFFHHRHQLPSPFHCQTVLSVGHCLKVIKNVSLDLNGSE